MIFYLTSPRRSNTIESYLQEWGSEIADLFRVAHYDSPPLPSEVSGSTIFADVESASPAHLRQALSLRGVLPVHVRCLNHPAITLDRRSLLRALHDAGVNSYRAYGLDERLDGVRFPCFVRHARQHNGPATPLIWDHSQLRVALMSLRGLMDPEQTLVVEHVDVQLGGVCRKYSCFRVMDNTLAHHVMFRRDWVVKGPSMSSPDMALEEREFQDSFPHAETADRVFRMAGVQYGRMDYGVRGGRPEIWEINTNPTVLFPRRAYSDVQMPARLWFSSRLNGMLRRLA